MLSAPDGYPLGVPRRLVTHRPPIGRLRRVWGAAVMAVRHLRTLPVTERHRAEGDATDLPAPWPLALVDRRTKTVADGHGPLYHRTFTVRAVDATHGAAELIETLSQDLDRGVPPHVVTFARERGEPGTMRVGDEYRVYMPAPWDGPVRVLSRTAYRVPPRDARRAPRGRCHRVPGVRRRRGRRRVHDRGLGAGGRPRGRDRLPAPRDRSGGPGRALAAVLPRRRAPHRRAPRRVGVRRHAPCPRLRAAGLTNLRSAVASSQSLLRRRS